jgi:hypothetical protein
MRQASEPPEPTREATHSRVLRLAPGASATDEDLEVAEPQQVRCSETELTVTLKDGRKITTPLWWYPRLLRATPQQRSNYELSPFGVHWPEIDEDLSVTRMLRGAKAPGARQSPSLHGIAPQ